jgi:hypothetical protein
MAFGRDREHEIKCGIIYNLAKYCDWESLRQPSGRFVIGVYRTKAFDLDIPSFNGRMLHGRTISVVQLKSEAEIANCQIAIIGDVGSDAIRRYNKLCRGSGTMLVGESDNFAEQGGMVGFLVRDGNVRFQVNLQAAQSVKVAVSSKLLILADQVFR